VTQRWRPNAKRHRRELTGGKTDRGEKNCVNEKNGRQKGNLVKRRMLGGRPVLGRPNPTSMKSEEKKGCTEAWIKKSQCGNGGQLGGDKQVES